MSKSENKLATFVGNIAHSDVARKNKYEIIFTDLPGSLIFPEFLRLRCESVEFPGRNFMSQPDLLRYGPPREMATGVSFAPINATFICSPNMVEKVFFQKWQAAAIDMNTWEPRFYKDYTGGMKISQLDRQDNYTYIVELFEVYPKTITAQDLGYATNDAYQTIAVELIYHHWELLDWLGTNVKGTMDIDVMQVGTQ